MINKGRRKKTLNEVEPGKATHKNNLSFPEKHHIPRKSLFHRKVNAYDLEFFSINGRKSLFDRKVDVYDLEFF